MRTEDRTDDAYRNALIQQERTGAGSWDFDRYDEDDPITCGWRRAVADMRAALESEARP